MYKLYFALFLLCLPALSLSGQDGTGATLQGLVIDENGTTIPFASVVLFNSADSTMARGAATNDNGNFEIDADPGNYYLKISFLSYEHKLIPDLQLTSGNIDLGTIQMQPSSLSLEEVNVTAEKSQMELRLDKRVFNVGKDLANAGNNASEILDNLPSVTVDVEGNISLRGSQGVRILIDGQPSGFFNASNPEALRQLQGNLIERVEVITNPSARYDAEGEVGIINIVLKKDQQKGFNGSFDLTAGVPHNHTAAYNLNYRTRNFNLFSSYSINYRNNPGSGFRYQEFSSPDTSFAYRSTREHERGEFGNTLRVGADYFINPRNTITFSGLYGFSNGDNPSDVNYEDLDEAGNVTQLVVRSQNEKEIEHDIEFDLNYTKTFAREDRKFTATFQWYESDDLEEADITETNVTRGTPPLIQRSSNTEDERTFLFQSDYVHPFGEEGQLEAGIKGTFRTIENDYLVEELTFNEIWEPLPGFNNFFVYQENIYAGYVMAGNKFGAFSWQLGLRAELSDITTELKETRESNKRNYLDLFPTAHFSLELDEINSLQLSYSRRINRPWFRLLLPFSNFSDSRNFWGGNPDLNPEYTHSFEFGHLLYWPKGSLLSSIYYRYRTGVIERITLVNENGLTFRQPVNLATENNFGLEFNANYDLSDSWRVEANFNFYRAITDGSFEGQELSRDVYTWTTRTTSRWTLFDKIDFQLSANYRAPRETTQGKNLAYYRIDSGLSFDFLKGNGTLTLTGRDLLNSRKRRSIIESENFFSETEFQWRARQVRISFNYRLNQKKKRGGERGGYEGNDQW